MRDPDRLQIGDRAYRSEHDRKEPASKDGGNKANCYNANRGYGSLLHRGA